MLLTFALGMNIVAAKIKPKPVCLMASDKRACVQFSNMESVLRVYWFQNYSLHLSSLQIVYYTGLWVFLLNYGSDRVWTGNMFCVQSGFPLLKWLGDSTGILLHDIMVEPRWCLYFKAAFAWQNNFKSFQQLILACHRKIWFSRPGIRVVWNPLLASYV